MRQLTKHDVNKLTAKRLKELLPFQIISDGEVIAAVIPACDVNKLEEKRAPKGELPLSKAKQAQGKLGSAL